MNEQWEEVLDDIEVLDDLEKSDKREESFESSLKSKLENIPLAVRENKESDDEEVIDSDEELQRAIRESRENPYKDRHKDNLRESSDSDDSKGKDEQSDDEIKPIRVMRRINPEFRGGSKVNLKNILEQQQEDYEPFGRDALNIGSVRPIIVEPMRSLNPNSSNLAQRPIETNLDFIYFAELNGCRNLINQRPVIFHWFKTFLFLNGTITFKLKDVSPKDGILRVYFINEHLLLKANQDGGRIEQHFISKAYYDRPFLCHLEAEGKFHTFACQIGLDNTKMEYYLVLLQNVFIETSKKYIDVTVPLLSLVHIIDDDSPVNLYFSGEIMTTEQSPTD